MNDANISNKPPMAAQQNIVDPPQEESIIDTHSPGAPGIN
jgi:hypothetical protein